MRYNLKSTSTWHLLTGIRNVACIFTYFEELKQRRERKRSRQYSINYPCSDFVHFAILHDLIGMEPPVNNLAFERWSNLEFKTHVTKTLDWPLKHYKFIIRAYARFSSFWHNIVASLDKRWALSRHHYNFICDSS